MSTTTIRLATVLAVASIAFAEAPNARTEFYSARPVQQARTWVGMKTSLLLRSEDGQRNCQFREVAEDFQFREGDRFRIRLQSNAAGYLYIVARDAQANFRLLFPSANSSDTSSHIGRFETRMIPDRDWFAFDANAGQERMYLFLSPAPMKEFERLIVNGSKPVKNSDLQKLVDRADDKASATTEESGLDGDIGATYVVSQVNWKSDPVLRRFRFRNYGK